MGAPRTGATDLEPADARYPGRLLRLEQGREGEQAYAESKNRQPDPHTRPVHLRGIAPPPAAGVPLLGPALMTCSTTQTARTRSKAKNPPVNLVHPLPHEAGVALTLPRHLRPAREEAGRGEEEPVPEVGRVVRVLLEGGVADLLVVGIVLELARGEGHRAHVGAAIGSPVGGGGGGGGGGGEGHDRLVELGEQGLG